MENMENIFIYIKKSIKISKIRFPYKNIANFHVLHDVHRNGFLLIEFLGNLDYLHQFHHSLDKIQ